MLGTLVTPNLRLCLIILHVGIFPSKYEHLKNVPNNFKMFTYALSQPSMSVKY